MENLIEKAKTLSAIQILYTIYKYTIVGGFTLLIFCYLIFGGSFSIQINFHSAVDLWNSLTGK